MVETEYFILLIVFSIALVRIYRIIKRSKVGQVDLRVLFLHLGFVILLIFGATIGLIRQLESHDKVEYQSWLSIIHIDIHMINQIGILVILFVISKPTH